MTLSWSSLYYSTSPSRSVGYVNGYWISAGAGAGYSTFAATQNARGTWSESSVINPGGQWQYWSAGNAGERFWHDGTHFLHVAPIYGWGPARMCVYYASDPTSAWSTYVPVSGFWPSVFYQFGGKWIASGVNDNYTSLLTYTADDPLGTWSLVSSEPGYENAGYQAEGASLFRAVNNGTSSVVQRSSNPAGPWTTVFTLPAGFAFEYMSQRPGIRKHANGYWTISVLAADALSYRVYYTTDPTSWSDYFVVTTNSVDQRMSFIQYGSGYWVYGLGGSLLSSQTIAYYRSSGSPNGSYSVAPWAFYEGLVSDGAYHDGEHIVSGGYNSTYILGITTGPIGPTPLTPSVSQSPVPPNALSLVWSEKSVTDVLTTPEGGTPTEVKLLGGSGPNRAIVAWLNPTDDSGWLGLLAVDSTGVQLIDYVSYAGPGGGSINWEQSIHSATGKYIGGSVRDDALPGFRFRMVIVWAENDQLVLHTPLIPQALTDYYQGQYTFYGISADGEQWTLSQPSAYGVVTTTVFDIAGNQLWSQSWESVLGTFWLGLIAYPYNDVVVGIDHQYGNNEVTLKICTPDGVYDRTLSMADYPGMYNGSYPYYNWRSMAEGRFFYLSFPYGTGPDFSTDLYSFEITGTTANPLLSQKAGRLFIDMWEHDYSQTIGTWEDQLTMQFEGGALPSIFDEDSEWYAFNLTTANLPQTTYRKGVASLANYQSASMGFNQLLVMDWQFFYFWDLVAGTPRYPLRLSQRNDDLGTFQRHPRFSSSVVNRNSSSSSNRIWNGQVGTYQ